MYFSTSPDAKWSPLSWGSEFQVLHGVLAAITITITVVLFFKSIFLKFFAVWPFFNRRHDFFKSNFQKAVGHTFSFNVFRHSIIAVKGARARKEYFDGKDLDASEGYKILTGAAPRLESIQISGSDDKIALFAKRITSVLQKERLSDVMPCLLENVQNAMDGWGTQGTMDPFINVYDLVFQMTVHMFSCRELGSDLPTITKLQKHFWTLERTITPMSLLVPWLPTASKFSKLISIKAMYATLRNHVEERKKAAVPSSDAIDILLADGVSNNDIIQFIIGAIFAGVINIGANSCWILLYISFHSSWKSAIRTEVLNLLAQHTDSSEPLYKRLSSMPVSAWEENMPTLDAALRESLRLTLNGLVLRRNTLREGKLNIPGGGGEVSNGAFLAYDMADAHLNPDIYTDPGTFDPERFNPGREEDKREPYSFLGWGAGQHPCKGFRAAKLEVKMIVAMFVVAYEYDVVDSKGKIMKRPPVPDYNDLQKIRPKGGPCFLKFKRVVE